MTQEHPSLKLHSNPSELKEASSQPLKPLLFVGSEQLSSSLVGALDAFNETFKYLRESKHPLTEDLASQINMIMSKLVFIEFELQKKNANLLLEKQMLELVIAELNR